MSTHFCQITKQTALTPLAECPCANLGDDARLCPECEHLASLHTRYGCEHEGGDVETTGYAAMAEAPCGCTAVTMQAAA